MITSLQTLVHIKYSTGPTLKQLEQAVQYNTHKDYIRPNGTVHQMNHPLVEKFM